jgi:hypothetical protein
MEEEGADTRLGRIDDPNWRNATRRFSRKEVEEWTTP